MTEQQNQKPLLETRLVPMAERTSAQVERGQPKYHRDINPADSLVALSFLGDVLIIILGLCVGYWIKFRSGWITFGVEAPNIIFTDYVGLISLGTLFLLSTFGFLKLYDSRKLLRYRQQGVLILKGSTFWLFAYLGTSLALKFDPPISRIYVLSSWICVLVSLIIWRWLFHQLIKIETVSASLRQRILFIGWNQDALRFAEAVNKDRSRPYKVVGCVNYKSSPLAVSLPSHVRNFGEHEDLSELMYQENIDIVILADLETGRDQVLELSNLCEHRMVQFKIIPSYFQILVSGLRLETISGVPIMGVSELPLDRLINRCLKRTVDLVGAVIGLIIFTPVMFFLGLLIYLESPGPILFAQERIGRLGIRFKMLKLRSMQLGAEKSDHENQSTLRNDPRTLRIGSVMRRMNLDELPQFWNVLVGEMSLVGPRPERTFHSEKLSKEIPHYNARYSNKPGITGWAQVNGLRGDTNLVERVRYDLFYLENWSLWLDFQIMIQTFVKRENAY